MVKLCHGLLQNLLGFFSFSLGFFLKKCALSSLFCKYRCFLYWIQSPKKNVLTLLQAKIMLCFRIQSYLEQVDAIQNLNLVFLSLLLFAMVAIEQVLVTQQLGCNDTDLSDSVKIVVLVNCLTFQIDLLSIDEEIVIREEI